MTTPNEPSVDVERLAEAYVARLRAGEDPDPEEYARAHPAFASEIRRVFRAASLMEGLKPSTQDRTAGADDHPADTADPAQVGPYQIVRRLGRGGMGRVFEALAPDGTRVALKLIHPHLLQESQYVDRFLQEAQLGQRVDHPNVVRTIATGTYDTTQGATPYLVLEYVEGQDLKGLLREVQVVPERLARHIGLKLAEALTTVHAAGIVHRDIKPENVVITTDEDVKLMDLGVGLLIDQARRLSLTGQFVGSLLYAAPEQFQTSKPDGRTDLYALGLMLYELVAGALPFGGIAERTDGLAVQAWRDLENVSPYFRQVLRTLLEAAPEDRFASSADLCSILRRGESSDWWLAQSAARHVDPLGFLSTGEAHIAFHGRSAELSLLTRVFGEARRGHGRAVWLEGEAGIGKSRLLAEWLPTIAETASPDVLLVRHEPGEHGAAASPLAHAIVKRLGAADLHATLQDILAPSPVLVGPLTNYLLGGRTSEEATQLPTSSLGPGYLAILRALAQQAPVVLLIEDLHFAPEQTHNSFLHLARNLAQDRILLLGTSRPDGPARCRLEVERLGQGVVVDLVGLTDAEGNELFDAASNAPAPGTYTRRAVSQAGGNPLFLLELARSWRRHPSDTRSTGALRIPSSIRSMFESRLSGAAEEDRELLDVAACFGAEFDPLVVAAAANRGAVATLKALAKIERAGGVLRTQGPLYRFAHHLLHETLYEAIHPALRQQLHASIARGLAESPDYVNEPPEALDGARATLIARQWLQGAQPDAAAPYLPSAITWLSQRHAVAQVLSMRDLAEPFMAQFRAPLRVHLRLRFADFDFQRRPAQEILAAAEEALRWSDPDTNAEHHIEMLNVIGRARQYIGDRDGSITAYEESLRYAKGQDRRRLWAFTLQEYARTLLSASRADEAIEHLHTALELVREVGDRRRELFVQGALSSTYLVKNRLEEAAGAAERTVTLAHESGDPAEEATGRALMCKVLIQKGDFRGAAREGQVARRLYREFGLLRNLSVTNMSLSRAYLELGELERAHRVAHEAVAQGEELAEGDIRGFALLSLVRAALGRGQLAEAVTHMAAADAITPETRTKALSFQMAFARHRVSMACGRLDDARRALVDLEAAIPAGGKPDGNGPCLEARAELLAEDGDLAQAGALLDEALRCHTLSRTGSYFGRCKLSRARVAHLAGDEEEARRHFADVSAWARAGELPSDLAISLSYLARHSTEDLMAAKVLVERDRDHIQYRARMEASFALWEATWSLPFLKEAESLLAGLRSAARPEDRDHLANVALHRRILSAR